MSEETDKNKSISLYEVLNVNRDATKEEIRKGYKKMSLLYHPDKNPNGTERFQLVNRAHEILMDDRKRVIYDQGGMDSVEKNEGSSGFSDLEQKSPFLKAIVIAVLTLLCLLVDYFLGIPFEFALSFVCNAFALLGVDSTDKIVTQVLLILCDVVIWLMFDYTTIHYMSVACFFWTFLVIFGLNGVSVDLAIGVWALLTFSELFFFQRIPMVWTWMAANCITMSVLVSSILSRAVPHFFPNRITSKFYRYVIHKFVPSFETDGFGISGSAFWIMFLWFVVIHLIWILDYFVGVSLEWMIVPLAHIFLSFATGVKSTMFFDSVIPLIVSWFLATYVIPSWIITWASSLALHWAFAITLYKLDSLDVYNTEKEHLTYFEALKALPIGYVLLLALLFYRDTMWRTNPQAWLTWGLMTVFVISRYWLTLLVGFLDLTKENALKKEKEKKEGKEGEEEESGDEDDEQETEKEKEKDQTKKDNNNNNNKNKNNKKK